LKKYKWWIFTELYKIRTEEIADRKEFLASQMKKLDFGKIVFAHCL